MDPQTATALIKAGSNIGSTVLTNKMNRSNARDAASYQNFLNTQNWYMQNAYNSPASQMQRLRAAGLNPNLIYQSGLDNTAGSVPAPQVQNPVANAPQFDFVGDYVSLKHAANETKQVDSVVDLNTAYEKMSKTQQELLSKEVPWKDKMLKQEFINSQYQALLSLSTANKLEAETGFTRRQVDTFYMNFENMLANDRVQRAVGEKNISLMNSSMKEIEQKILESQQNIRESQSRVKMNKLSTLNMSLEYARGMLAYRFDQAINEFMLSNGNYNLKEKLSLEIKEIEARIRNMNTSNVTNPLSDLVLPLSLFFISRGRKMPQIGFKH